MRTRPRIPKWQLYLYLALAVGFLFTSSVGAAGSSAGKALLGAVNPAGPVVGDTTTSARCETLAGTFSDVASTAYYCSSLWSLAMQGAISGYSGDRCTGKGVTSPCFLPHNQVTRTQFAKMLVLTFAWDINTQGGPHFSDVPTTDWAYPFVETAYNRGVISGYSGAECTSYGLGSPCFHPGFSITRGQIAKMVALGANFGDSVVGRTPTFADVASDSPFYVFVEQLVMQDANVQYPPGLSRPNCPAINQPCFYPNAVAIRADASALLAYGFFATLPYPGSRAFAGVSGWFNGTAADITTPDLSPIPPDIFSVSAKLVLTDRWNGYYIEAGAQKLCSNYYGCSIHPYATWSNRAAAQWVWDTTVNLIPNQSYGYQSTYTGSGGQWQASFCSGVCRVLGLD